MTALESDLATAVAVSAAVARRWPWPRSSRARRLAGAGAAPLPDRGLAFEARARLGDFDWRRASRRGRARRWPSSAPAARARAPAWPRSRACCARKPGACRAAARSGATPPAASTSPPEQRRVGAPVPGLRAFPASHRAAQRPPTALARGTRRAEAREAAADVDRAPWPRRAGGRWWAISPADSVSGSPWPARWPPTPRVLLLDEPSARWTWPRAAPCARSCARFLASCGLPTVLVTHDPVDALAFGDRMAVLEAGRLSQVGSREKLLAEPRTRVRRRARRPEPLPGGAATGRARRKRAWSRSSSTFWPTTGRGRRSSPSRRRRCRCPRNGARLAAECLPRDRSSRSCPSPTACASSSTLAPSWPRSRARRAARLASAGSALGRGQGDGDTGLRLRRAGSVTRMSHGKICGAVGDTSIVCARWMRIWTGSTAPRSSRR